MSYAVGPLTPKMYLSTCYTFPNKLIARILLDQDNISPAAIGYHRIWIMLVR